MRLQPLTTLGTLLLFGGLLVGAAAAVGPALGVDPTRLSPFILEVALYKLTFIAALGLIAAGALVRRHARGSEAGRAHTPSRRRPFAHRTSTSRSPGAWTAR